MSPRLPEKGLWHVSSRQDAGEVPFELIKIDLRGRGSDNVPGTAKGATGTVRARNLETRLRRIRVIGTDRFAAVYDIRGHRGEVDGVLRADGSLGLSLTGTVTASFAAYAAEAQAEGPGPWSMLADAMDTLCGRAGMAGGAAA